jgi:hypothetical protein
MKLALLIAYLPAFLMLPYDITKISQSIYKDRNSIKAETKVPIVMKLSLKNWDLYFEVDGFTKNQIIFGKGGPKKLNYFNKT